MRSFFKSQGRRAGRVALPLLAAVLGFAFVVSPGQQTAGWQNAPSPLSQTRGRGSTDSPFGEQDSVFAEKQLKALNEARQKALVSDTQKLLKLTQELNAEISSSAPSSLTSQQLRKLASIEKLAHNVKEKMSESYVSPSLMHDPLQPLR